MSYAQSVLMPLESFKILTCNTQDVTTAKSLLAQTSLDAQQPQDGRKSDRLNNGDGQANVPNKHRNQGQIVTDSVRSILNAKHIPDDVKLTLMKKYKTFKNIKHKTDRNVRSNGKQQHQQQKNKMSSTTNANSATTNTTPTLSGTQVVTMPQATTKVVPTVTGASDGDPVKTIEELEKTQTSHKPAQVSPLQSPPKKQLSMLEMIMQEDPPLSVLTPHSRASTTAETRSPPRLSPHVLDYSASSDPFTDSLVQGTASAPAGTNTIPTPTISASGTARQTDSSQILSLLAGDSSLSGSDGNEKGALKKYSVKNILRAFSEDRQPAVKRLLDEIELYPNVINWDRETGQVEINNSPVATSNITKLLRMLFGLTDISSERRLPRGYSAFESKIQQLGIPETLYRQSRKHKPTATKQKGHGNLPLWELVEKRRKVLTGLGTRSPSSVRHNRLQNRWRKLPPQ